MADFFVGAGRAFPLRVGQTAGVQNVTGEIYLINFANVTADSRCPVDVTCVEAGSATVVLSIQTSLALNEIEAAVAPSGTSELVVEEITVELIQLTPEARDGVVIGLLDYELGLRVNVTGGIEIPQ